MPTNASKRYGLRVFAIALAVANLVLWFGAIQIRNAYDAAIGRADSPLRPLWNGVPELLVYYDPWLARGIFPLVYTLGIMAIAFLWKPPQHAAGTRSCSIGSIVVAMLLLGFEAVWLFLFAFGIVFRGPNWTFYWPGEAWDPHKVVPQGYVNLSDYFWIRGVGKSIAGMPWLLRESPGLVFVASYFLLGLLVARGVCWMTNRSLGYWRSFLLVFLTQLAALIPLKMLLRWSIDLKYFVAIPEYFLNV